MQIKKYLQSDECLTSITLLIFMLCGAWVRVSGLSEWYWSPDDAIHLAVAAGKTPLQVIHNLIIDDTHPPLYYFIIHYMQQISRDEMFLRASSLVPGLVLIPLSYLLGRVAIGRAAGIFIAFIVAFGYGSVVISEVIRQYTLFLCMITGALCCMFAYNNSPKQRYLVGYGILMFLTLFTHYTSVIVIAGTGTVWFFKLAAEKKYKEGMNWVAIHVMLALTFGAIYYFFIVPQWIESPYHEAALSFWLMEFFPGYHMPSYLWLLLNFINYISFMYDPVLFVAIMFLNLIGIQQLIAHKKFVILGLSALLVAINVVLAILVLYPFSPGHQCLYLFPFLILLPAFAVQKAYEQLHAYMSSKLTRVTPACIYAVAGVIAVVGIVDYIERNNFYRTDNIELPIKKAQFERAMNTLQQYAQKDDLILTEKGTAYYLFNNSFFNNMENVAANAYKINYNGKEFHYLNTAAFELKTIGMLQELLTAVSSKTPLETFPTIWFVSAGWCQSSVISQFALPQFIPSQEKPLVKNLTKEKIDFLTEISSDRQTLYHLGWEMMNKQVIANKVMEGCPSYGGITVYSMKPAMVKEYLLKEKIKSALN